MKVAATGWLWVVLEPTMKMASVSRASENGFDTEPPPIWSSSAATDEAWHSRVQWSTLLVPKTARMSFWNR